MTEKRWVMSPRNRKAFMAAAAPAARFWGFIRWELAPDAAGGMAERTRGVAMEGTGRGERRARCPGGGARVAVAVVGAVGQVRGVSGAGAAHLAAGEWTRAERPRGLLGGHVAGHLSHFFLSFSP